MSDMLKAIEPKSDQINAEDLLGGDRTITITGVQVSPGTEQPVTIRFEGSAKVFRPCKTVSRIIVKAWGPDTSRYIGKSLVLFRDPAVTWGGMAVGGIRVRAMSHIDGPLKLALAESKKNRKITVVEPLVEQDRGTGYTIEEARAAITSSTTIDGLRAVWSRKQMAPYRGELQGELDARKAVLTADDHEEGPADEQRGEAFTEEAA